MTDSPHLAGWFDVDGERRYCYLTESGLMRIYFEPLMKDLFGADQPQLQNSP